MPLSFSAFYNDEVKKVELKYTLRDISYDELEKYT